MRNWIALENDIASLQSQPCLWPAALSTDSQKRYSVHNQYVLEKLIVLTRLPISDDEKAMRLRQFLALRWKVIANSSIDYTLHPDFPANQGCLKTAVFLVQKEESVCQILMPTLSKVLGTGFVPSDIKSASENSSEQFVPHNFLICLNDEALISIVDLFSLARVNTNHLFPSEDQSEQLFHFTAEDRERLRLVAGKKSAEYFDALYRMHCVRYKQKPSVGFALKTLQQALMKSSKKDKGSEEAVNIAESRQPVLHFYQLWSALPLETKNQIKDYKANGASFSLESYLLCLFVHMKEHCSDIVVSESEFQRVCSEEVFPCAHQIALQLDTLLNHHVNLFNISLNDQSLDMDKLPNAEELHWLSKQMECGLLMRSPLLGWCDQYAAYRLSCFETLTKHCLDEKLLESNVIELGRATKTIEELTHVLIVLPISHWERFLGALQGDFIINIFDHNGCVSFNYLLTHLPSQNWLSFFNVFYEMTLGHLMNTVILGSVLYELQESEWPVLVRAMEKISDVVFLDGVDIVHLFGSIPIDHWEKICDLFSRQIEFILKNPVQLVVVYQMMHKEEWPLISKLFEKNILEHMKHGYFLETALEEFQPVDRLIFLKAMAPYGKQLSLIPLCLFRILKLFRSVYFSDVLSLIGWYHLRNFIKTAIELAAFLRDFSAVERIVFVSQLPCGFLNIQIGATDLSFLLKRFPECEGSFLRLFKTQLPNILSLFVSSFSLSDNFRCRIPDSFVSTFKFLSIKILPVILDSTNIGYFCGSFICHGNRFFCRSPDPVLAVHQNIKKIECALMAGELTPLGGVIQKITILGDFERETLAGGISHTVFYDELVQTFGKNFFTRLHNYLVHFQVVNSGNRLTFSL